MHLLVGHIASYFCRVVKSSLLKVKNNVLTNVSEPPPRDMSNTVRIINTFVEEKQEASVVHP